MAKSWVEIFYRAASIIAGLLVLLVIANTIYNISEGEPVIPVVALVLAGLVWLIGWSCRSIFADDNAKPIVGKSLAKKFVTLGRNS